MTSLELTRDSLQVDTLEDGEPGQSRRKLNLG